MSPTSPKAPPRGSLVQSCLPLGRGSWASPATLSRILSTGHLLQELGSGPPAQSDRCEGGQVLRTWVSVTREQWGGSSVLCPSEFCAFFLDSRKSWFGFMTVLPLIGTHGSC